MNRAGVWIRLGLKGLRRLGLPALVGLVLGLYLLSLGMAGRSAVRKEKLQPVLLTAACDSGANSLLAEVRQLQGVKKAAAGIPIRSLLVLGEYSCSLTASAVTEGWLTRVDEGTLFPEQSSMPYLVLNRAALQSFVNGQQRKADEGSLAWRNQPITINGLPGQICGVLDDGSQTPAAWLSASAGESLLLANRVIPSYTLLLAEAANADAAAAAEQQLYTKGCSVTGGVSAFTDGWEQGLHTAGLYLLSGTLILAMALVLLAEGLRRDLAVKKAEYRFLRYNGMSRGGLCLMLAVRIGAYLLLSGLICLLLRWLLPLFQIKS